LTALRTVFFAFLTAFFALPLAALAFFALFLAEDFAFFVAAEIFRATLLPNVRAFLRAALASRTTFACVAGLGVTASFTALALAARFPKVLPMDSATLFNNSSWLSTVSADVISQAPYFAFNLRIENQLQTAGPNFQ
jgi:hypothetical protein